MSLIRQARSEVKNKELGPLQTCWEIGLHIIEFDPGQVAPRVFAKDFDEHKLQVSYQEFSIWNAVRTELSWTYFLHTERRVGCELSHPQWE